MRASVRMLALWLTAVALLSGCEKSGAAHGPVGWPPGAAGMACNFVDYDRVEQALGIRFDTAGGARKDDTHTCALTQSGHEYPDLTFSIAATSADDVIFQATVAPTGSTLMKSVGRIGYRLDLPAAGDRGPALELGWLSAQGRIMIIRYTFGAGATADDVAALAPRLVRLAKQIEAVKGAS